MVRFGGAGSGMVGYGEDWLGMSYVEEYTASDRFDAAVRAFEER